MGFPYEANTVAQHFVTKFVCLQGIPQTLVTDCGTEFWSHVFKEVCKLLKIRQTSTTPYESQSNGSLGRHRSLAEYLGNFIGKYQLNWDTKIPYAMFYHNSSVHSATYEIPVISFGLKKFRKNPHIFHKRTRTSI